MTTTPQKVNQTGLIANTQAGQLTETVNKKAANNVGTMLESLLDAQGYRKRFDELMGARTPQFISSIISLVNGDNNLKQAAIDSPITIIQSALKAATFDLPIDPSLGYAYIVPFNNKKDDGSKKMEASFIMGYKGMKQLALRTGVYETINVVDVREGELKSYNRLTEDIALEFIENEEERQTKKIIGWCGYYRLVTGTKKTIYRSRKQIEAHERKHRKGQYMGKGWRDDFDAMAEKTVYRELIGKHGLMSIDYQKADKRTIEIAEQIAREGFDDEDLPTSETPSYEIDEATGEVQAEQ